jgi:hypothetical protein
MRRERREGDDLQWRRKSGLLGRLSSYIPRRSSTPLS